MQEEGNKLTTTQANTLETDYRAELIAATLIEQGFDSEKIEIVRDGISRRGFAKDIEQIEEKYSDFDLESYIQINANKEGMYDMLPEGIFHKSTYKRSFKDQETDAEKALEEIKIHREQEFFARRFFQLFELIADRTITNAYLFEHKYDKKISNSEFSDIFVQYWPILQQLTLKQSVLFMYIMPIIHRIRSHYGNIEQVISCILDVPVEISKIKLPAKRADSFFESHLGRNNIGVNMVLGNKFDDGEYDLNVTIGPISAERMRGFLETAKEYRILDELCGLFLPANTFVEIDFKIDPEDSAFVLSDENNEAFLGINSFI